MSSVIRIRNITESLWSFFLPSRILIQKKNARLVPGSPSGIPTLRGSGLAEKSTVLPSRTGLRMPRKKARLNAKRKESLEEASLPAGFFAPRLLSDLIGRR
jgi:hypothetical protein